MKIVTDAAGKILMWSESGSPEPSDGCNLVDLDDAQSEAFTAARSNPNSGLIFTDGKFSFLPPQEAPVIAEPTKSELLAQIAALTELVNNLKG